MRLFDEGDDILLEDGAYEVFMCGKEGYAVVVPIIEDEDGNYLDLTAPKIIENDTAWGYEELEDDDYY